MRNSSVAGLISFREVLHDELTRYPDLERSNVYLLEHNEADELLPLLAATFGLIPGSHARDYGEQLNARTQSGAIDSYLSYLELVSSMSHRKGWLHLVNRNLGVTRSAWYPPTVVVVAKSQPLRDLALFWNLRDHLAPRAFGNSILLIPEEEIENPPSLQRLAKELARSEIGSNHCMARSAGCPKAILDVLARRLRPRLTRTKTEAFHVDVQFGPKVPGIYCGAREQTVTLAIADDIVTIPQLEPGFSRLQALSRWACDLTKDLSTNRYPFELDLPKTGATLDLLNLPPGPFVHFGDRLSFGPEFLSVLMTESSQASTLRIRLPSAHELFEVVLAAGRVTVLKDEKNIRYTQTLSLFGDLSTACAALTCAPGRVLDALYEKANPLTYEEICGLSRAGKRGRRAALPKMASLILQRLEGTSRKIAERRVRTAMGEALAHDTPTDEVLRLLSAKGVIRRRWKLDRCGSCDHSYWLTAIDLSQPLLCPGCGRPVLLKNAVAVGYALNALARLALKEGFRPVVLTARFLERLGLSGFIWHAGAKIEHQGFVTDIDILACCDGRLIAGECKDLGHSNSVKRETWDEIKEQLMSPIKATRACGFEVFVFSCLVDHYPARFQAEVRKMAGGGMHVLFLGRDDLENGYREIADEDGHRIRFRIDDVFAPYRRRRRRRHQGQEDQKGVRRMWL